MTHLGDIEAEQKADWNDLSAIVYHHEHNLTTDKNKKMHFPEHDVFLTPLNLSQ